MKNYFKNHNWIITLTTAILLLIGIVTVFSTTYFAQTPSQGQGVFPKHLLLVCIGLISYYVITSFDYRFLKEPVFLTIIYIVSIILLLYARFLSPEISQTTRWIKLGPFSIQPAEFTKISIILITSAILFITKLHEGKIPFKKPKQTKNKYYKFILNHLFQTKFLASLLIISPLILLILTQPALGNALISLIIFAFIIAFAYPDKKELFLYFILLFISTLIGYFLLNYSVFLNLIAIVIFMIVLWSFIKISKLSLINTLIFVITGLTIIPIFTYTWNNHIKPYQKSRIESFLNPQKDPQGQGWQVNQARIAVGSAGIFGKGFMQGTQSRYSILPFSYTDFAFAGFYEQFGLIGGTTLLGLLLFLCYQIFIIAKKLEDPFASTIVFGIMCMFFLHTVLHIGMNVGILPVTGIPLPLVSYGGSSIVVNMIALGIIQNTLKYQKEDLCAIKVGMYTK